jgi:hypothetical protein
MVFTCLSQDIVIHEATHAILDVIRDHFDEPTGPDSLAFHEGFADVIALLQHFSFRETLLDTIQRTGGQIHRSRIVSDGRPEGGHTLIRAEAERDNPIVNLARQFGEAIGKRAGLRDALGTQADPEALRRTFEPHERGGIFVAAIFDAFFSVYLHRTQDLFRIAYPDGRIPVPNFLHRDLAIRLADAAAKTARTMQNICLRALDYCPPVDITFGDYLRAIVTADKEVVSEDSVGYRNALISSFRARGIRPEGVRSYAEAELAWNRYGGDAAPASFRRLWSDLTRFEDQPSKENEDEIRNRFWRIGETMPQSLGLARGTRVEGGPWNLLQRVRPDGSIQREMCGQVFQSRDKIPVDKANPSAGTFVFRGGTTLIVDREGQIRYSIFKPFDGPLGEQRLTRQREYLQELACSFPLAPYQSIDFQTHTKFRSIHRGY